jgi:hypothetical protein
MKSAAKTRSDNKWNSKAYWFPRIFFPKDDEQRIREAAADTSLNAFITSAVYEKLEKISKNG